MSLELTHKAFGDDGPVVIVLHGLLGSARNWTTVSKRLAEDHRVFALDLRNHGAAPWADGMTYDEMAEDVRAFIERRELEPVTVMGHSMGGKVAMRLALSYRDLVERLVVVDVAPVSYEHSFDDFIDAMRSANVGHVRRRAEVEEALSAGVPEPGIRAFLLQNLVRDGDTFRWRLNLDAIAINMDDITGWPTAPGLPFEGPALFVAGATSDYVTPDYRAAIDRHFPAARLATVRDAGHWVHAEQPEAFTSVVRHFLAQTAPG